MEQSTTQNKSIQTKETNYKRGPYKQYKTKYISKHEASPIEIRKMMNELSTFKEHILKQFPNATGNRSKIVDMTTRIIDAFRKQVKRIEAKDYTDKIEQLSDKIINMEQEVKDLKEKLKEKEMEDCLSLEDYGTNDEEFELLLQQF